MTGVVYTETIVHVAPARFIEEAPYQIVIVALKSGGKLTGRVKGPAVRIGDPVEMVEQRDGICWFAGANEPDPT